MQEKKPKILLIASQKGGVGKTTLAANIAIIAEETLGKGKIIWFDADPQESLVDFYNDRKIQTPLLGAGTPENLKEKLSGFADAGIELIVIDSPPNLPTWLPNLIEIADFILIPTQDGLADIRACAKTVQMVKKQNKPFAFVLTMVKNGTKQAAQASFFLSEYGPLIGMINHRMVYKTSWAQALGVSELSAKNINDPAVQEINTLWTYIGQKLHLIKTIKESKIRV